MERATYPASLQFKIENAITHDDMQKGSVFTTREMAQRFDALEAAVWQVVKGLIRKGLADEADKDSIRIHGLPEAEFPYFKTQPGAGPRHCTFSPVGKYCYLINELDCTILVLSYDKKTGVLEELQTVSSLPEGLRVPGNTCADIHITPDGRFLYGSNRGHNSLIIYKINRKTGLLDFVDCQPCGGEIPRNFAIDPTGNYLLCANQDSDDIVVFRIDNKTGRLSEISRCDIPTPVCVKPVVI